MSGSGAAHMTRKESIMFKFRVIDVSHNIDVVIRQYGITITIGHIAYQTIRKNKLNKFLNKFPLIKRRPLLVNKIKKIIKKYS